MPRLLIVEDQKRLLGSLRRGLEEEGYEVVTTPTGEEGYYLATTPPFDALVLDLMLPGRDGLRILHDLRAHGFGKPVLILTSWDAVTDRVKGLDGGCGRRRWRGRRLLRRPRTRSADPGAYASQPVAPVALPGGPPTVIRGGASYRRRTPYPAGR